MSRIGMCSWSIRPAGPSELVQRVRQCNLAAVQLGLDPIRTGAWNERDTQEQLHNADIAVLSGMMAMRGEDYSTLESIRLTGGVRSDANWAGNLAAAHANAALAQRMKIKLVTFHAGFLPHEHDDRLRHIMLDRLRQIADVFADRGVSVAFETGQESAATLLDVLQELNHPTIGVNFDPGNMILYGMGNPIDAFALLANRVKQVHIKDAIPTATPGTWGREMPTGHGSVDWAALMQLIRQRTPTVDLVIERECGSTTVEDVRAAHALINGLLQS